MHVHILGIAGTFMGGLAQLAAASGHRVTGADAQVYPPMSTQLEGAGISFTEGFEASQLAVMPDQVVVGNVMTRGKPIVEHMLDKGMSYTSGPEWLAEHILKDRWVLAVAGTHGKTSTSSMLAWILDFAGLSPGFLIGGVPENFGVSARLGDTPFFVIEADEYDTAFFDKRSKFVHYRPRTLVMNNLEYDHADIFPDLAAIQTQFHHLVRTVPGSGLVISPACSESLDQVIERGCWTPVSSFGEVGESGDWGWQAVKPDCSQFDVFLGREHQGTVRWSLIGEHNAANALASIAAARHVGVPVACAIEALAEFKGIKRRMELKGSVNGISVYDDFAHHPTAIATTLAGLRRRVGPDARILAVMEPRSNTMRLGTLADALAASFDEASLGFIYSQPDLTWSPESLRFKRPIVFSHEVDALVQHVSMAARPGDHILVMSNGGFGGIHGKLLAALEARDV